MGLLPKCFRGASIFSGKTGSLFPVLPPCLGSSKHCLCREILPGTFVVPSSHLPFSLTQAVQGYFLRVTFMSQNSIKLLSAWGSHAFTNREGRQLLDREQKKYVNGHRTERLSRSPNSTHPVSTREHPRLTPHSLLWEGALQGRQGKPLRNPYLNLWFIPVAKKPIPRKAGAFEGAALAGRALQKESGTWAGVTARPWPC